MIPLMMQKDYKPQGWRKPQPHRVACGVSLCCDHHALKTGVPTRSWFDSGHEALVRDALCVLDEPHPC